MLLICSLHGSLRLLKLDTLCGILLRNLTEPCCAASGNYGCSWTTAHHVARWEHVGDLLSAEFSRLATIDVEPWERRKVVGQALGFKVYGLL